GEGWLIEFEAAAKVHDHVGLGGVQDVQGERRAFDQPLADFPALLDCDGDERRLEGALLHPAGEHAGFQVAAPGRDHKQAARNLAQRPGQLLVRFGAHDHFFCNCSTTSFSTSLYSTPSLNCLTRLPSRSKTKTHGGPSKSSFACHISGFSSRMRLVNV